MMTGKLFGGLGFIGLLRAMAVMRLACNSNDPESPPAATSTRSPDGSSAIAPQSDGAGQATTGAATTIPPTASASSTYVVESGDYRTLIAAKVGAPAEAQDAWVAEMLALNGTEATLLQVGQTLQLPPSNG
jgi:LysM repeat protein